jgi:protein-S-isoprenylcysteine O-methyltransferase Ste14
MRAGVIGVALVPVWWLGLLCLTDVEEAGLERTLGVRYRDYRRGFAAASFRGCRR